MRIKHITLFSLLILGALGLRAQYDFAPADVTTFQGIAIDGPKADLCQQLTAQGYQLRTHNGSEYLEGRFYGKDVCLFVAENNGKAYRIMAAGRHSKDAEKVKREYNSLIGLFADDDKYLAVSAQPIPESEDIEYTMTVEGKAYEALFYQNPDPGRFNAEKYEQYVMQRLKEGFPKANIERPTAEMEGALEEIKTDIFLAVAEHKAVWFRISESNGQFWISIYFDNIYNKPAEQ